MKSLDPCNTRYAPSFWDSQISCFKRRRMCFHFNWMIDWVIDLDYGGQWSSVCLRESYMILVNRLMITEERNREIKWNSYPTCSMWVPWWVSKISCASAIVECLWDGLPKNTMRSTYFYVVVANKYVYEEKFSPLHLSVYVGLNAVSLYVI